jgi:hypothetical protein
MAETEGAYAVAFSTIAQADGGSPVTGGPVFMVGFTASDGGTAGTVTQVWDASCNPLLLPTTGTAHLPAADNAFTLTDNAVQFSAAGVNCTLPLLTRQILAYAYGDASTAGNVAYTTVGGTTAHFLTTSAAGAQYQLGTLSAGLVGAVEDGGAVSSMPCSALPCTAPLAACSTSLDSYTSSLASCSSNLTAETARYAAQASTANLYLSGAIVAGAVALVLLLFMLVTRKRSSA